MKLNFVPECEVKHNISNIMKYIGKGVLNFVLICTLAKYNQVFLTGAFLIFIIVTKNKYGYFNSLHKEIVTKYKNELMEAKVIKRSRETEVSKSDKR